MRSNNKELCNKGTELLTQIKDLDIYEQLFIIKLMEQIVTIRRDLESQKEMISQAYSKYLDKMGGGPKLNS